MERVMKVVVDAFWDEEAEVWVASSDDVPGLVTEADTVEMLRDKLATLIPELLEANGVPDGEEIPVELLSRSSFKTNRSAA